MKEFENDPNELNENGIPSEEPKETPVEDVSEEASVKEEPLKEEPKKEEPYSGAPYGYQPYQNGGYQNPQPPQSPKKMGRTSTFLVVFCLVLSIFVGITAGALFGGSANADGTKASDTTTSAQSTENTSSSTESTSASSSDNASDTQTSATAPSVTIIPGTSTPASSYSEIATKCVNTVVMINVTEVTVAYGQEYETAGAGSGVIYTQDGYIITNYHVVNENTRSITVTLYDGSQYEGKYIYGDEYVDLAVIKIEKNDCDYAVMGDFEQMRLGDEVLAIGNPLGYGLTVTNGIISALDRSITIENTTMTLLQTSAAINSGNSGGGLFNMKGELIGIVNAKIAGTSVEGMGFAIPSTTVAKSINDLKEFGYITGKARLGVSVQTKQYQTWPYMQTHTYIQVMEILDNGSAAKSGLQVGDILHLFNDTEITSFEVLSQQLTKYKVGDTVKLTVRRPTIELTGNNLSEYLTTSEIVELEITFVEFNPNA